MPVPILICDDSGFARKQMARSLPDHWDVEVSFAAHGAEAVAAIKDGKSDILFLDLNMPVMDGYQVLEAIRAQDLPTLVIVVSGDVQPEARERVIGLGALDFIKKPIDKDKLSAILEQYGILQELDGSSVADAAEPVASPKLEEPVFDISEGYQEVANVAMGQAADLLARLLKVFIELPIPKVSLIPCSEFRTLIKASNPSNEVSLVSQGFVGAGIAGEGMLFIDDGDLDSLARLIDSEKGDNPARQLDLLMEISNILIGACMAGFAEQLDLKFSMGHPALLGQGIDVAELPLKPCQAEEQRLAIEIRYGIKDQRINCTLLLVFTGDSIAALEERINLLVE